MSRCIGTDCGFSREEHSAASRNHREDGRWKSRKKSQGNVCQGNNRQNAFSHSLDNHSPDFALENVFKRVGGRKIFAKLRDSEGLQYKERFRLCVLCTTTRKSPSFPQRFYHGLHGLHGWETEEEMRKTGFVYPCNPCNPWFSFVGCGWRPCAWCAFSRQCPTRKARSHEKLFNHKEHKEPKERFLLCVLCVLCG